MLARILVMAFESIMFIAVASFVILWLVLMIFIVKTLVRIARASGSLDPFKWLNYMRSPQGSEIVQAIHAGRKLLRFAFVCVAIAATAGVAAAVCATIFHVT
jgi:hypothetical protein